ncbi:MAG: SbcC/MukB-like Walker B domain-containing protein [Planctomycetaceae bacterium]
MEIQKADAAIGPLEESLATAGTTLAACEVEVKSATGEYDALATERNQIFDGRPVDDVERELTGAFKTAAELVESITTAKHESEKLLAASGEAREAAHRAHNEKALAQQSARDEMRSWLTAFRERTARGLSREELDAVLLRDEAWINGERQHLKSLDEAVQSAEGACRVRSQQLEQHKENRSTDEEEPVVLAAVETLQRELLTAKENAETARAVVLGDDQRAENATLADELNSKRSAAEPWLKLNELIGSADGAKFRMIAQRRTLDVLLSNANHQLSQLAARYRLERLPESLNLVVIDCDMGDERRSVHSLSGGESFLVSLALALGLASLASNRLRIESLFIDEGFGSLDPDTLNTAMNALMHLEAQGRKVGVISHVKEMTDAIPVKINVVKRRGGASRVVVPGAVRQLPDDCAEFSTNALSSGNADSRETATVAEKILQILHRERQGGKDKVSLTALRKEIDCPPKDFKAAQSRLGDQVTLDGRSLRLCE